MVPSAPIVGESSILLPPVENGHPALVAPLLAEVLNWLRPLCERSCSYVGQTVVTMIAPASAAAHIIKAQIAAAVVIAIRSLILPLLILNDRLVSSSL